MSLDVPSSVRLQIENIRESILATISASNELGSGMHHNLICSLEGDIAALQKIEDQYPGSIDQMPSIESLETKEG